MAFLSSRLQLIAVCTVVFVAGAGAGGWAYRQGGSRVRADLTGDARRCAAAFSAGELGALSATRDDLGGPAYAAIKARLVALRRSRPGALGIYLLRRSPVAGTTVFLADSEEVFLPGDTFRKIAETAGGDDLGARLTGYAVVAEGAQSVDILGVDIEDNPWGGDVPWRVFRSAVYVWLLLGVPAGLLVAGRRRGMRGGDARMLVDAVEQSRAAVMIADLESRIVYVNRQVCEQTGYGKEELIGRGWAEFRAEESPPETLAEMVAAVRGGRSWEGEWINRKKNGEACPVRGLVSPVHDRRGRPVCFLALFKDVTGLKRAEAQAKGEFLATMGHELRTPLNGIVRFAGLLRNTTLSNEQRDHVRTICLNGEALLKVTGNLLDYSWLEAGRMPLDPQPCDVRALIEGVFELLSDQAVAKNLVLRHRLAPEVPVLVEIDAGRLRQVLVNLLGNAVKFTAAGEVSVEVGVREGGGSGGIVLEFSVRDTGPGIAADDQGRLFRPFSQVSGRRHGGTGLGLVISRSLVRLMGGDITLESALGEGAVFRFHVSARPLDATPARVHPQLGLRLLLVDDSAANLRLLQSIAGVLGCECTTAAGGQEGFDAIARGGRYDAVLLDLQMPGVDGVEVLRRLRAGEAGLEARDIWVTIVTADGRAETRASLFELGCDDFMTKPVTVKSCLVALQRVVRHRPAANG
ncbi:MAG: ATP-binding protein [Opitutaceae bacterium]|jgi:PAS domain S-box-containing protein